MKLKKAKQNKTENYFHYCYSQLHARHLSYSILSTLLTVDCCIKDVRGGVYGAWGVG